MTLRSIYSTIPPCGMNAENFLRRAPGAVLLACATLGGLAFGGDAAEHKSPRALPDLRDVMMQAQPVVKSETAPTGAHTIDSARAPRGSLTPNGAAATRLPRQAPAIDHSRVYFREAHDGALWARGAAFKSEFRSDRATFVPSFGSRAEKNHPVAFRVESATSRGEPIPFAASTPVHRDGERVVMQRAAFTEHYDVTPGGMEQSFTFSSLANRGDLSLRIGYETDLDARATTDGIEFANELGAVRYAAAVAIDANGERVDALTGLDHGAIVITVPASFVAHAALPLTIDPLISTFTIDGSVNNDSMPDVAYDATTSRFAVVYQEWYSQTDNDAYAVELDTNGNFVNAGYIDLTVWDWNHVRVANNGIADQFMVVATVDIAGLQSVRGVTIPASTFAIGQEFVIADESGVQSRNPDIGGDPSPSGPTFYCVTWERIDPIGEHDIQARIVTSGQILYGPGAIPVDNSAGTFDSRPAISKCDGNWPSADQAWTIVWQRQFSPTDHDIFGARIAWDGAVVSPSFTIDISAQDDMNPTVSSPTDWIPNLGRRALVAFERNMGNGDRDVWGVLLNGGTQLDATDLSVMDDALTADVFDQIHPCIDSDGAQFALTYTEQPAGFLPAVFLSSFNGAGNKIGLSSLRFVLSPADSPDDARIAAVRSGGASGSRFLAVYDKYTIHPYAQQDVVGTLYDGPIGGAVTEFCGATNADCPCNNGGAAGNGCANSVNANGAHLTAQGNASLSHDTLLLWGTGMPSSSTCIYMQGTAVVSAPFGDGWRCAGGQLLRIATKHNSGGASSYPHWNEPLVSIKGQVPAIGGTRYYQTYYRDPASFCTALTYNITNGVSATWVP